MKKFILGMLLLSLIFILSGIIMLRTQVDVPQDTPEEESVYVQPTPIVHEPVENIVETVETVETVEDSLVHSDPPPDKTYTDEELDILALIVY